MANYPSTTAHFLDILVPNVAHYGLSDAPEPLSQVFYVSCSYLHRCRQILTDGEKKLGKAWQYMELVNMAL